MIKLNGTQTTARSQAEVFAFLADQKEVSAVKEFLESTPRSKFDETHE